MQKPAPLCLSALMAMACLSSAHAEDTLRWPNWYAGLHGGMNFYDSSNTLTTGPVSRTVDADAGYILGASVGYKPMTETLLDMTRWEVEYSFRGQQLNSVGTAAQGGSLLSHTLMANLILDFSNPTIFTPYVGAGYGFSEFDFDGDDETADAWQLLAGIDYTPVEIPAVTWGMRYRYLDTDEGGIEYDDELSYLSYDNHSVELATQLRF